jgi:hypothetical protein
MVRRIGHLTCRAERATMPMSVLGPGVCVEAVPGELASKPSAVGLAEPEPEPFRGTASLRRTGSVSRSDARRWQTVPASR